MSSASPILLPALSHPAPTYIVLLLSNHYFNKLFFTLQEKMLDELPNLTSWHRNKEKSLDVSFFCCIFVANKMIKRMTNEEILLTKILKMSHQQVTAGKSFSQEEAERFLDDRLYSYSILIAPLC